MSQLQVSRISWYSVALMILTSFHHAYGAVIYHTPWRLHILIISVPVIISTLIISRASKKKALSSKSVLFWIFYLITLIPSVGLIGAFEGIYNHVLKNILFFGGLNDERLQTLFPVPTYEMPNDLLFEISGVMQGVIVVPLIICMISLTSSIFKVKKAI